MKFKEDYIQTGKDGCTTIYVPAGTSAKAEEFIDDCFNIETNINCTKNGQNNFILCKEDVDRYLE